MVLSARAKRQSKIVSLPVHEPPKKKKRRKLKPKLKGPGLVIGLLLLFALYSFGGQLVESHNVQQEIQKIQQEMEELQKKNEELRSQVKKLESEAWVERVAREKLGLVKPGEKLILEVKPNDFEQLTDIERANIEVH